MTRICCDLFRSVTSHDSQSGDGEVELGDGYFQTVLLWAVIDSGGTVDSFCLTMVRNCCLAAARGEAMAGQEAA